MSSVLRGQETFFSVFNTSNDSTPVPPTVGLICFELKDYKEIIYNSPIKETLCFTIEKLTNDSEESRIAKRNKKILANYLKGEIKIPRPQNAFMIYRRNQAERLGIKCSPAASKRIGKMWEKEPSDVKIYFQALAMMAQENHTKKYGKNYRYQPKRKPKKIVSRKQTRETSNQHPPAELKVTPPSPSSSIKEFPTPPAEDLSFIIMNANIDSSNFAPPTGDYPTPLTIVSSDEEDINADSNFELMPYLSPQSTNGEDMNNNVMYQALPNLGDITVKNSPPLDSTPFFDLASMLACGYTENPLEDNLLVNSAASDTVPDFVLYPSNQTQYTPTEYHEIQHMTGDFTFYDQNDQTEYLQFNETQHMTAFYDQNDQTEYSQSNETPLYDTSYDFQFDDKMLYQDFFNYEDQALFNYDDYSLQ